MGSFERKILEMLSEATAAGNYPADFSQDVQQAQVPTANAVDKKWPMESDEDADDEDMMVAEDDGDDDADDMEGADDVDDDDDEVVTEDDDADEDDEDEDDEDMDSTFSEMISRLKEADSDPEKPEGELDEADDEDEDDEVVTEKKKTPPMKNGKFVKVKEGKKKKVKEGAGDDMPDFLKKKLDKDGDGEPDVKEDVQAGEVGLTEPDAPEPSLKVTEGDEDDDLKDDETAMFGEASLPEAFRQKASVVFEAAVKSRAAATRKRVAEEATKKLQEAYNTLKRQSEKKQAAFEKKLSEQVDRYLTYVSGQWMKENRLAVEAGIRAELAEDFISGLKKLFVEHYIEVPSSKIDVVKVMGKKLAKMEGRLNDQTKENVKLRESITRYRRDDMVRSASRGLTATQADKLKKLSEGLGYQTRDQFASALNTLKESYFPKETPKGTPIQEDVKPTASKKPQAEKLDEDIAVYVQKLSKKS